MTRVRAVSMACALALFGCPGTKDEPPSPPAWRTILDKDQLDRAVLSVWGTSERDVFVVGGPLGNSGFQTLAHHFDGSTWRDLAPGGTETFWWVNGTSATDVWMVGTGGRIAHWDGKSFAAQPSGTTATLFGAWSFAKDDAWIVGGTPGDATAPNDVVLHWDGTAWKPETLPDAPLHRALFKVWGTSSSDLYVVGEAGTIWHRRGTSWTLESKTPLARGTLLTVFGCSATEVYAVGNGDVLMSDGNTWSKVTVDLSSQVNGVSCIAPGTVAIVGGGGLKQRLVSGKWIDEFGVEPFTDLHAVWGDPASKTFWAVGGDFLSAAVAGQPRRGVVARYGPGEISRTVSR
jgi:hypothetical protein